MFLRKCLKAGLRATQDQGVHIARAFICVHRFKIYHVTNDIEFQANSVAAMHVAGMTGNCQRFAAIVALNKRDHFRSGLRRKSINYQGALGPLVFDESGTVAGAYAIFSLRT